MDAGADVAAAGGDEEEVPEYAGPERYHNEVWESAGMLLRFFFDEKRKGHTEAITDCLLRVICAHEHDGELAWEIQIIRHGKETIKRDLDAKTMESPERWNAWASNAQCCWNLSYDQRWALKRYIHGQPGAQRVIHSSSITGVHEKHGVVIATGHCIGHDGSVVPPDENGMFKLKCADGLQREFAIISTDSSQIPSLNLINKDKNGARTDLRAYLSHLHSYLNHHGGAILLGWAAATVFARRDLVQVRPGFPHAYVTGPKGSGKNVLGDSVYEVIGFKHVQGIDASSSRVSVRNQLADTSAWPLWINEMDHRDGPIKLLSQIRAAFDGQASQIGRKEGGTISYPVRRGLMLSGQHVVGGDAELSRYIVIKLHKEKRDDARLPFVHASQQHAAAGWANLLTRRVALAKAIATYAVQYQTILKAIKSRPDESGDNIVVSIDDRQAWCWGIALAGLRAIWADEREGINPMDALPAGALVDVIRRASEAKELASHEGYVGQFWAAVGALDGTGKLSNWHTSCWAKLVQHNGKERIAIAVNFLWSVIKPPRRAGGSGEEEKADSLVAEMKELGGFHVGGHNVLMGNRQRRCCIFDVESECIPEWVRDAAKDERARRQKQPEWTA